MNASETRLEYCPNCLASILEYHGALGLCFACGADWPVDEPSSFDARSHSGGETA